MSLTELAEGLFIKIAVIVFIAGFALRFAVLFIRRGGGPHPQAKKSTALGAAFASVNWIVPKKGFLRRNPAGAAAAIIFHVAISGILLFNEFHVLFIWEDLFGISWEPVSEQLSEILTITALLALAALFLNRAANSKLRALSTFGDFLAISLVG